MRQFTKVFHASVKCPKWWSAITIYITSDASAARLGPFPSAGSEKIG
jgi:hypothetical protein